MKAPQVPGFQGLCRDVRGPARQRAQLVPSGAAGWSGYQELHALPPGALGSGHAAGRAWLAHRAERPPCAQNRHRLAPAAALLLCASRSLTVSGVTRGCPLGPVPVTVLMSSRSICAAADGSVCLLWLSDTPWCGHAASRSVPPLADVLPLLCPGRCTRGCRCLLEMLFSFPLGQSLIAELLDCVAVLFFQLFLSPLCTPCGARTHNPETESCMSYQRSQPGAPAGCT